MLAGDRPTAFSPKIADSASGKDDVETPLRYSAGINASIDGARRIYRGKMAELNVLSSRLSCTRGCRISRCPTPVISSRGL